MTEQRPSLAEALETARTSTVRCPVAKLLATMPEPDASSLAAALGDLSHSARRIHKALRLAQYSLSYDAVKSHRSGNCSCEHR